MAYFYRSGNNWRLMLSRDGVKKDVNLGSDYQRAKILRSSIEQAWQNDCFKRQLGQTLAEMGLLEQSEATGNIIPQKQVEWGGALAKLLDYFRKAKKSERTVWLAEKAMEDLKNTTNAQSITDITTQKVDDWTAGLLSRKNAKDRSGTKTLSSSTVSIRFRAAKACFEKLRKWKLIKENPFSDAEKPRAALTQPRPLTPGEFGMLLTACNAPLKRCVLMLRHSGMRPDEFYHLTWKRVRIGNEPAVFIEKDGDWMPKSYTERMIPCPAAFVRALGTPAGPDELVCGKNRDGFPVGNNWLERSFRRALKRAGLDRRGFTVYSLRDTYATELALQGAEAHEIAAKLGHRNLQTSMRYVSLARINQSAWKTRGPGRKSAKAKTAVPHQQNPASQTTTTQPCNITQAVPTNPQGKEVTQHE